MRILLFLLCFPLPAFADMQSARDAFTNGQFELAVKHLEPAANSGSAEAEFLLGNIHALGLGHPVNAPRGFEFYFRAASKGHPAAQLRVSRAFQNGAGTPADPIRALLWAELAKIGAADGAAEQADDLRNSIAQPSIQIADRLLQDYRTYLFPFASQ